MSTKTMIVQIMPANGWHVHVHYPDDPRDEFVTPLVGWALIEQRDSLDRHDPERLIVGILPAGSETLVIDPFDNGDPCRYDYIPPADVAELVATVRARLAALESEDAS